MAVLACGLAVPPLASANLFVVNSIGDEADETLDGSCLTEGGKCTLRAAIEESNDPEGEFDEILFEEEEEGGVGLFNGQLSGMIDLSSSLPAIAAPVRINGDECDTAAGVRGPCVGIDGPNATAPALIVENTEFVEIEGLAVTNAETGIEVIGGSEVFKARGSWFGIKLDGSAGGNTTGIFIDPESDEDRIGGEESGAGNVFANNVGDGLDILGASNVRVLGNYFGVKPDGATLAANGKDIEVTSTSAGGVEAIGTVIGTRVSSKAVATPECDGGCNLISGAESSGIDLEGNGGLEAPAVATTIAGNYVGLNAAGTASVPNKAEGIRVGEAAQTVIGGPKAGETNRLNGGEVGVLAGPAAADLVVRGNLIGVDAAGSGSLAPPEEGIVVDSEEFASAAVEAAIVDNRVAMEGGVAIAQQGYGARIAGNEISSAETGIWTHGATAEHGNLIAGNSIEGLGADGILVENGFNEILGNEISGAGGAGILIKGSLPFDVTENLVGGDTAAEENIIVGSGGDAIQISNVKLTENEVARNRGILNGGLFINLVAATPGPESDGPNNGIKPPLFSAVTQTSASGSGAEAGANVRVFRKQIAEAGELESFLGEATADAEGNWKVVYADVIPAGTIVAATQTSEGGTSELSVATIGAEGSGDGGSGDGAGDSGDGSGSGAGSTIDKIPPETKIFKGPRKKSKSSIARFKFDSDELVSTFQCKLDGKPFRACKSPKTYEGLKPGRHVFKVRAIDPAGNIDSSPAKKKFTILAQ